MSIIILLLLTVVYYSINSFNYIKLKRVKLEQDKFVYLSNTNDLSDVERERLIKILNIDGVRYKLINSQIYIKKKIPLYSDVQLYIIELYEAVKDSSSFNKFIGIDNHQQP